MSKKIFFLVCGLIISAVFFVAVPSVDADSAADTLAPAGPTNVEVTRYSSSDDLYKLKFSYTIPSDSDYFYINIYRSTVSGQLGDLVISEANKSVVPGSDAVYNYYEDNYIKTHSSGTVYFTVRAVDLNGNISSNTDQVFYYWNSAPNTEGVIQVSAPSGGSHFETGDTMSIAWTMTGSVGPAGLSEIWLYKGNDKKILIKDSNILTANVYNWVVPESLNLPQSPDYKVRVISADYPEIYGDSGNFTIGYSSHSIAVVSPNGGEKWVAGSQQIISWKSTGPYTHVGLSFFRKSGLPIIKQQTTFVIAIPTSIADQRSGSFSWTVANDFIPADDYILRAINYDYNYPTNTWIEDQSDAPFGILAKGSEVPLADKNISIKLISPNGGEKWQIGNQYEVKWSATNVNQVSIALQKGGQYVKNLIWNLLNNSTAAWTPDLSLTPGNDYKIRITDPDSSVYDESDSYFSINKSESEGCLPDGTLIKLVGDPKIYVIVNCQKKWIQTAEEFNKDGYKWSDVKEVTSPVIKTYADYLQVTANLLRAIGQEKVYKLVNGKLLWVPTISAFNAQGLKWSDVQSVDSSQLNQYQRAKLLQVVGDPKIYYVNESGLKKHIINEQVFNSYNNKWDDIVKVSATELNALPDVVLIKKENDNKVYKLEDGKKQWIKTPAAFNRLKLDWTKIAPVNSVEINAYSEGKAIE